MQNPELAELDASLQAIVRRAYDLGRSEALKRVVDVLNADRPSSEQLALMAPDKMDPDNEHEPANGHALNGEDKSAKTPWWAWPVR